MVTVCVVDQLGLLLGEVGECRVVGGTMGRVGAVVEGVNSLASVATVLTETTDGAGALLHLMKRNPCTLVLFNTSHIVLGHMPNFFQKHAIPITQRPGCNTLCRFFFVVWTSTSHRSSKFDYWDGGFTDDQGPSYVYSFQLGLQPIGPRCSP